VGFAGLVVRIAKARYRAAFTEQLPESLDVFSRGRRAGQPVSSSLAIVVETSKGPLFREFSRCHNEICMGTTLPESLARLEARVPTAEVSFFTVATTLQAETGGNLIETIESIAAQLRERRKLRKKARALSSGGGSCCGAGPCTRRQPCPSSRATVAFDRTDRRAALGHSGRLSP
jgi:tight adherence protein B